MATASLLVSAAAALIAQPTDPVVHMSKEPRHKVVLEQGPTRVQDIQIPPGDTSLFHVHDNPVLYVPISSSRTRSQLLGQDWTGSGVSGAVSAEAPGVTARVAPARVTSTISYVDTPITHRVNNVGDGLFRLIGIGNLSEGTDVDTDDICGLSSKPEVLNRYYRAYRVSLAAGASTPPHKHAWPVLVVQQTAGQLTINGSADARTAEPGNFAFHDGSGTHQVTNTGAGPIDAIEVELRGAAAK
jgi:quercetin dioxygenase-like cupin family protein